MKIPETQIPESPEIDEYVPQPEDKPLYVQVGLLLDKTRLLWSRRRYVLRTTILAAIASIILALIIPKRYEATVYLMPPDSSSGFSGLSLLLGMKGAGPQIASSVGSQLGDMLGMKSPGQLYIRALQSRSVEDRIIDRFDLKNLYGDKLYLNARKDLESNTDLKEDKKSGVITIAVTDKDPKRAAQIANAYAEELDRLLMELNSDAGARERRYYEEQLTSAKVEMERAAKQMSEFAGKNVAIDVPEQGKAAVEAMALIQGQLIASEAQLKGLLEIYNDGQGPVQAMRAQIAELKRQMAQMGGKDGQAGDDVLPNVKKLTTLGVPFLDLYRNVKIQEAVVETLTEQYELAKLQESHRVATLQVLDPAEVPEKKSSPHRTLIVLACTFLAFCYAATRVIANDWWDNAEDAVPWKQVLGPITARRVRFS